MVANQPCIQEIERIYLEEDRCVGCLSLLAYFHPALTIEYIK